METGVALQILPQGLDTESVLRIVDKVIAHIAASGLKFEVGPFETVFEGPFEQCMQVVKECQILAAKEGASQVASYVKIFYSPGNEVLSIDDKLKQYR